MTKNLSVVVAGSGAIKDIIIKAGTTAKDIVKEMGLTGYRLSKNPDDPPFGENENIYPKVKDGDKLYASTRAVAGRVPALLLFIFIAIFLISIGILGLYYTEKIETLSSKVTSGNTQKINLKSNLGQNPFLVNSQKQALPKKKVEKVPITGSLFIKSKPSGAKVYLDGNFKGVSPLCLKKLPLKSYQLKLLKEGYQNWEKTIKIESSQREISADLKLLTGYLSITSNPSGAKVFLNRNYIGDTPISKLTYPIGSYKIRLEKEDYLIWENTVKIEKDKETTIFPILKKNLLVNGDFRKDWPIGWNKQLREGITGPTWAKVENEKLHLYHSGKSFFVLYQGIEVEDITNLMFKGSFRLKSWHKEEGLLAGWGAGMVLIELQYQDAKGNFLGKTRIMNTTKAFLSGTGLAGVPEPQGGSPTSHIYEIKSDWYKDFKINIEEEIKNYLLKVDFEKVKRIYLILDIAGSDGGCGGEAYIDNLSLYYEK